MSFPNVPFPRPRMLRDLFSKQGSCTPRLHGREHAGKKMTSAGIVSLRRRRRRPSHQLDLFLVLCGVLCLPEFLSQRQEFSISGKFVEAIMGFLDELLVIGESVLVSVERHQLVTQRQ